MEASEDLHFLDSEDEDAGLDEYKHNKLLSAISSLDGKKREINQRSEPAVKASEFHVTTSGKVHLNDLVGALRNTTSHGELKKQLNRIQGKKKVLQVPLHKHEQDQIQRSLAYESTAKDVSKWDAVVEKNRKAEQLHFPLEQPVVKLYTTDQMIKRFQPRTPLEMEIAALLQGSPNVLPKQNVLTVAEERALRAMNIEEAKQRRADLQKYRALLSYKESKCRRQKKIKSKSFHRILRKEKVKQETKAVEELKQNDPEAYMERLKKVEKDRVQERMSQKHRGGSKFMKRQALYGKYNDQSRDAVQEMIKKNKELTKKMAVESESDSDSDGVIVEEIIEEEVIPSQSTDAGVSDMNISVDKFVQWQDGNRRNLKPRIMPEVQGNISDDALHRKRVNTDDEGADNSEMPQSDITSHVRQTYSDENSETQQSANNVNEADIDEIFKSMDNKKKVQNDKSPSLRSEKSKANTSDKPRYRKRVRQKVEETDSEESDSESDSESEAEEMSISGENTVQRLGQDDKLTNISLSRKRTLEDYENNFSGEEDGNAQITDRTLNKVINTAQSKDKVQIRENNKKDEVQVDPKKFFTVEHTLKQSQVPEVITNDDEEEEDAIDAEEQQRMTIAQAFAQDDVVGDFSREKRTVEDRDKPKDIDLTLPGWGSWGGSGIKPTKRKRKRFTIKAPTAPPRRDAALTNVIISETKDKAITKHQVNELPFPFSNVQQFEGSVRAPIGKTWNPVTAYKSLIKPKMKVRMGSIIEPINKAETFKKQQGPKWKTNMEISKGGPGKKKQKGANKGSQ